MSKNPCSACILSSVCAASTAQASTWLAWSTSHHSGAPSLRPVASRILAARAAVRFAARPGILAARAAVRFARAAAAPVAGQLPLL